MPESEEPIVVLAPSPARRWLAVGMTGALGLLCLAIALLRPPGAPLWIVVLLVLGIGALWLSRRLAVATRTRLELTRAGLRDGEGRTVAPLDRVVAVERGVFAFKPSNGFLVRLSQPLPRVWEPGLWWRFGSRVGIGGVTPSAQGRIMADALTALVAETAKGRPTE